MAWKCLLISVVSSLPGSVILLEPRYKTLPTQAHFLTPSIPFTIQSRYGKACKESKGYGIDRLQAIYLPRTPRSHQDISRAWVALTSADTGPALAMGALSSSLFRSSLDFSSSHLQSTVAVRSLLFRCFDIVRNLLLIKCVSKELHGQSFTGILIKDYFRSFDMKAAHIVPALLGPKVVDYLFSHGSGSHLFSADNCLIIHNTVERSFEAGNFVLLPVDVNEFATQNGFPTYGKVPLLPFCGCTTAE